MDYKEMALFAARTLDSKKAQNLAIIQIGTKTTFAEHMILASGASTRQVGALCEELEDAFTKEGIRPKSIQGKKESGWMLMDYGDIIVSILTTEMREKYNIEKVWADCPAIPLEEGA